MNASSHSQGNYSPHPIFKIARKVHKWLMVLVGVQVFIWALTGAYMVFPNIHYIHGDHLIKQSMPNLDESNVNLSFNQVLTRYPKAENIQLSWLGNAPIYRFTYLNDNAQERTQVMLDASTGKGIRPLQMVDVINIVPELLVMSTEEESLIDSVVLIESDSENYPSEIGRTGLPLWQIQLNTWDNTRLYIAQYTGEVVYVRHHAWRLFDLFWRLHIMDYNDGDEPENSLLAITSVLSLISIIAGLFVLYVKILSTIRDKKLGAKIHKAPEKRSVRLILKQSHKWIALIVFVQLLLWVGSGFLLGRIDHSLATGKITKLSKPIASVITKTDASQLVDISVILAKTEHVESVHLALLIDQWVYRVQHKKGRHDYMESDFSIYDAKTAEPLSITKAIAGQLALASHNKEGLTQTLTIVDAIQYQSNIPALPQEQNSVWQISVNDNFNTKIMLNSQTGEVISHVNDNTPLRNLLFKLHFMDYANEGSFNNIFSKFFALLTLILAFTGLYWLFELVKNKQFVVPTALLYFYSRKKVYVAVKYSKPRSNGKTQSNYKIKVNSNLTVLDGLAKRGFKLPSDCAGGGTCGQCVCQFSSKTKLSSADKQHLSEAQLEEHYRLACQHRIREAKRLIIYK